MNINYITQEGLQALCKELEKIKADRHVIVEALTDAREQGDLSENFAYHTAREKLREIDAKITQLEVKISNSHIIQTTDSSLVQLGSYVKVYEEYTDKTQIFRIVGEGDASNIEGVQYISYLSPVAKVLLDKKIDEVAELNIPAGNRAYRILQIGQNHKFDNVKSDK